MIRRTPSHCAWCVHSGAAPGGTLVCGLGNLVQRGFHFCPDYERAPGADDDRP